MRRSPAFVVAVLAAAVAALAGCGQERHVPSKNGGPPDGGTGKGGTAPQIPTVSHPEAKQVVERAITAVTGGHRERIEKTKVSRAVANGLVEWPGPQPGVTVGTKATRRFEAVWPDRIKVVQELPNEDPRKVLTCLRPAGFWLYRTRADGRVEPVTPPDPRQEEDILRVDGVGQYWLLLLTPLADPQTVVYEARKGPAGTGGYDVIKAHVPGCPVFTLWFDEKSGLPGRVEYIHAERRDEVHKVVVFSEQKTFDGLTLPTTINFSRGDRPLVEQWTVEKWEFPDRIEDSEFEPPK